MNKPNLPSEVDVAIIGGGIIGTSAAYALSKAGVRTAIFEKSTLSCEQSSRNWGWIRTLGRSKKELPLAALSTLLWQEIQSQVNVGYRQTGLLYLQENDEDQWAHAQWLEAAGGEIQASLLSQQEISRYLPRTTRGWSGGLFNATDGVAEPGLATLGIAQLATKLGCRIVEHCAVRGLDIEGQRVSGIITEHGHVRAGIVILAGGAWSRLFCGNHHINLPQLKVRASALRTEPIHTPLDITVNAKNFTSRKRADGGYTVSQFGATAVDIVPDSFRLFPRYLPMLRANLAQLKLRMGKPFLDELTTPRQFCLDKPTPFESQRVLAPAPALDDLATAMERLKSAFPDFSSARIAQSWAGYIDVTPDELPVISSVNAIEGFYLASGFSGHGFGIGPAVGAVLADLVQNKVVSVDLTPFRLDRFQN